MKKILSVITSLTILANSLLYPFAYAYAQEETSTPEPTPIAEEIVTLSTEPTITSTSEPTIEPILTPTTTPSQWTFEKVELNKEYASPQNSEVKLTFTKLPDPAGSIKIEEITLTEDQIKQTGSLSDKAYDITSDMVNGSFSYNLSLPIPESSKGKVVEIKFAEELSNVASAEKVENTLTKTDSSVSVENLDHFTIFIITDDSAVYSGGTWIDYATQGYSDDGVHYPSTVLAGQSATWTFSSLVPVGSYNVYVSWSTDSNRTQVAPYIMNYNGGSTSPIVINQEKLADQTTVGTSGQWSGWYLLGSYSLNALSNLVLSSVDNSSGTNYVIADEVLLAPNTTPATVWVDDNYTINSKNDGHVWGYDAFVNIQDGITAVASDGIINIASGEYIEIGQIVIDKNLTIIGEDKTTTIIKTSQDTLSDGDDRSWILVKPGINFDFSKATLNGEGYRVREAIRHHGSGNIDDIVITNIKYQSYLGTGINNVGTGNVDVGNSDFSAIERVGVLVSNIGTGTFYNNTYTGKGVGDWLDYGFDIQYGAHVTINNNAISNNQGVALSDGSDSAGISVWDDTGTQATITNNIFTNNHIGVAVAFGGYGNPTDPKVIIGSGNVFNAGDIGVDLENVGASGNPDVTFGASTFKGFGPTLQAIKIADGISVGDIFDISDVIFKDSSNAIIINSSVIEDLVYHFNDDSDRGLLRWDYVAPSIPELVSPIDGAFVKPASLILDWTDGIDSEGSNPVKYYYQSSYGSTVSSNNSLTSPIYTSGILTNSQIDASGTADNLYYWQVRACDNLDNCSDWSGPWAVTIDRTSPTNPGTPIVNVLSPTNQTNATWNWVASTDSLSGVKQYFWNIWNGSTNVLSGATTGINQNLSLSTYGDGDFTFDVQAEDNAGNKSGIAISSILTVDTTPPDAPTPLLPIDGGFIKPISFTQSWTAETGAVQYKYQSCNVDPGDTGDVCLSVKFEQILSGTSKSVGAGQPNSHFWWRIKSKDSVGNWSNYGEAFELTIDGTSPTVDIVFPGTGPSATSFQAVFNENVKSIEAENPANYFLNNWPGAGGSGNLVGDVNISYDPSTFTSTVTFLNPGWYISPEQQWGLENIHDLAGNLLVVTSYTEYSTSLINPVTSDSLTDSNWHNLPLTINLICTDVNGSGCKKTYYTTDGSIPTTASNFGNSIDLNVDGEYQIKYFSVDNAGNTEDVKVASNIAKLDLTNPTGDWISPIADETVSGIVPLNFSASDTLSGVNTLTYEYKGNDGIDSYHLTNSDWDTTTLPLDTYVLKATVIDIAGNVLEVTRQVNVASIISNENSTTPTTDSAVITWTTDRPTKSRVVYDTIPHGLGTAPNYGYAFSTDTFNTSPKVTGHSITITGLNADTLYYYRVISEGSPVAIGNQNTYRTLSVAGAPGPSGDSSTGQVQGISTTSNLALANQNEFFDDADTLDEEVLGEQTESEATVNDTSEPEVKGTATKKWSSLNIGLISLGSALLILTIFLLVRKKKNS